MKIRCFLFTVLVLCSLYSHSQRLSSQPEITPAGKGIVNPYVDNIGYWKLMVRMGYVKPQAYFPWVAAKQGSSIIHAAGVQPQDSPDVPVTGESDLTQSENSVFIDPMDEDNVLNSNNSTNWNQGMASYYYGADSYNSSNNGITWAGSYHGAGLPNNGDPAAAISFDGRWYVGKINNSWGQNVAYSTDHGATWQDIQVAACPSNLNGLLDKNHLWVDNSAASSFRGNVYTAWTDFIITSPDTNQVQVSRSNDGGLTWTSPFAVSRGVNAGKLNHGVNIATGPLGQAYLAWSIYDTWPADENAIGFTISYDGGSIWQTAHRIISNIKGIRISMTNKAMRVNSFPSMAVDLSNGPDRGTIYLVWANNGTPGVNTGSDINVYLIKSFDQGATWSVPVKVNQDTPGLGKEHYFPWITVDAVTGGICVIYYDDRNVSSTEAETWVSYSYDGGNSFSDFRVSDVSFTPSPIQGLAFSYFGDYIGIQSLNMKVYPVWTDNRLPGGQPMTWTSPFNLGPNPGQAWVMYNSNELSEIATGDTTGLDFGDSLHLSLGVKNIGDLAASNLRARVTSPSAYITMTDTSEVYPDLAAGQAEVVPNGFAFRVSDTIPDNITVRFNVTARNPDSSWNSHFSLTSRAPGLKIQSLAIYDTSGGNHNHRFDPGETDDVAVTVSNTGEFPCPAVSVLLSSDSPFLTILSDSAFAGTINPSQQAVLHYTVHVSNSAPTSAGVDLNLSATSGKYKRHAVFHEIIGMLVEDWETDTFLKFPWSSGGGAVWYLSNVNPFEGTWCVKSGTIYDSQNTQLWVPYYSGAEDSISFYYKTSTELGYDFLKFYVDNVLQGQWSGETPWSRAAFDVPAGNHIFKWIYQKDLAESQGQDRVWLDFIVFPVPFVPVIGGVKDDTICAGMTCSLHATVQQYDSLRWSTNGDGSFSDPQIASPVYTPGSEDIIKGRVKLELSAFNQYGLNVKDMTLLIAGIPVAVISVFPGDTVCHWQNIRLSADTTNAYSYLWTPGDFPLDTIYIDTTLAGGLGTKLFRLKVTNYAGCYRTDSVWLTFKYCVGIQDRPMEFSVNIFPNPTKGDFTVDIFSLSMETIVISIEDLLQNKVFEEKNVMVSGAMRKSYNFANLPSGIYILKIFRNDGTVSRKLIIDR